MTLGDMAVQGHVTVELHMDIWWSKDLGNNDGRDIYGPVVVQLLKKNAVEKRLSYFDCTCLNQHNICCLYQA